MLFKVHSLWRKSAVYTCRSQSVKQSNKWLHQDTENRFLSNWRKDKIIPLSLRISPSLTFDGIPQVPASLRHKAAPPLYQSSWLTLPLPMLHGKWRRRQYRWCGQCDNASSLVLSTNTQKTVLMRCRDAVYTYRLSCLECEARLLAILQVLSTASEFNIS